MKLRNVSISLSQLNDQGLATIMELLAFDHHSRALCNYINRSFYLKDHEQINPSRVLVEMSGKPEPLAIKSDGVMVAEVENLIDEIRSIPHQLVSSPYYLLKYNKDIKIITYKTPEIHDFLIYILDLGLRKLERDVGFPRVEVMKVAEEFRAGGYVNRWIHKTCKVQGGAWNGYVGKLIMEITTTLFTLDFVLENGDAVVHQERVATERPDENAFHGFYKELSFSVDTFSTAGRWRFSMQSLTDHLRL